MIKANYLIWILLLTGLNIFQARAQLSPGRLHKSHADLEGIENCTRCHLAGKQMSPEKCLSCHVILKEEIQQGKGLHAQPEYGECRSCHIEHQGRKAELVYWPEGKENFDHDQTGYRLKGAHAKLKCEQCHQKKNIQNQKRLLGQKKDLSHTFLGLNRDCLSCHHDEHRNQVVKNCLKCHEMDAWKPAPKFDHNKTAFSLSGKHRNVDCQKCHRLKRDKPLGKDREYLQFKIARFQNCVDCHQDFHRGQLGLRCQKCHTTDSWKKYKRTNFNHNLTAFRLDGKHQNVACEKCHKNRRTWRIEKYDQCSSCHVNYHRGQLTRRKKNSDCSHCHTVKGFTPSTYSLTDHEKSSFPLKGAHRAVPCIFCHKKLYRGTPQETVQLKFNSSSCQACHKDPHGGEVDKYLVKISNRTNKNGCQYCHNVADWAQVTFEHSLTYFKLVGRHEQVPCLQCHKATNRRIIRFKPVSKKCENCHEDAHRGQFGQKNGQIFCDRCHTPESWSAKKFDHSRDARFKLTGAHQSVPCNQCHFKEREGEIEFVRYKPIDTTCKACHADRTKKTGGAN